ncbi:ectopic P granules 5 -like protein [Brachionus plicatilis]|uniref:Ectopic P granules 5-like protein n=1 Tax=Brachionus plicatilis TaxID=10195 RepID=A0A3M7R3T6_BRAPC|nr:ectopic P granules 5 -like protein [Brachionus plicatilis]
MDFVKTHSNLADFQYDPSNSSCHYKHEFFELVRDYYEARCLVLKCERHINEYKWTTITEQMSKIWSFEKYTIESYGVCGDQQRCRHELVNEKAYLNRIELTKLQDMFYELRFNLIKNGLISSQFCSKLARLKLESYLHDFMLRFDHNKESDQENYANMNHQLKILIDILFFFYRKVSKTVHQAKESGAKNENSDIYYEIDAEQSETQTKEMEGEEDELDNVQDEVLRSNLIDWLRTFCSLLLNVSNQNRFDTMKTHKLGLITQFSTIHFENQFYVLQHLLRVQDALNFSSLIQVPFLYLDCQNENAQLYKSLSLNSSKSDGIINIYFDYYLKLIASFSYDILYRQESLGLSKHILEKLKKTKSQPANLDPLSDTSEHSTNQWQFIDLEGEPESLESILTDVNEDDLIKLYYQIPFNNLFSFLWMYLEYQSKKPREEMKISDTNFRKNYVSMKIMSFLDNLSRLSIRSLLIYNRLKFKNFSKLIGKTLREIVKFVLTLLVRNAHLDSLRVHYDNFVKRIFTTIIYSPRLKSIRWTILNQFNIGKLNLKTKWLLLSIMCGIDVFHPNFELIFNSESIHPAEYINQSLHNDLEHILVKESSSCSDIELLSFMKSLHFLIDLDSASQDLSQQEADFIHQVIRVIFKISYCYPSTQDTCYKEGNSILSAVALAYPCLIGSILSEIDIDLDKIGKKSLFLCADLPFDKWLPFVDLKKDVYFIQKCLLHNVPNSILFRLAVKLIDGLNFKMNTLAKSQAYLTNVDLNIRTLIGTYGLIDLGTLFKIRLSIILFELHSRLTNYSYFAKNENELFGTAVNFDELNQSYYKLAKEKRIDLIYWIWSTFYKMNLFIKIDGLRLIDYLEELTCVYSPSIGHFASTNYLCKFYQLYLGFSHQNELVLDSVETESAQTSTQTLFQSKCALESYLRLVYTCSGNNLNEIFDHSIELIQIILNVNKKFGSNMAKISYLIVFDWFDNLIRKFLTTNRVEEFRQCVLKNLAKVSQIVLFLFSFSQSQMKLNDNYCSKLEKNLRKCVAPNAFESYLTTWTELLLKTNKNWYKYKNIVKFLDFLLCWTLKASLSNGLNFVNLNLFEEFLTSVKTDFGLTDHPGTPVSDSATTSANSSEQESQNSAWFQPSFNWLSSSFTYVVNTTTNQISNTMGAAIGAITGSNTEFFESNIHNFTYDKRIYKECPYVGFCLSLCEERIEVQLSLWTVFRSFLLGISDPLGNSVEMSPINLNSVSFIENCWKKTLSLVNKSNNLALNIAPQRLMLFKWCERAIELEHHHPLLILYWQKFFNIYLDKDYHAALNQLYRSSTHSSDSDQQQVQSVTFKLFTSTSQMNSLLKQMKKHLELTSQHYAYRENHDPQINELMSKLFYALSLWIDETRLHDPNLYLPALPNHYHPSLLGKIFSKNCDLWTEFIELNKLTLHLSSISKSADLIKSQSASSMSQLSSTLSQKALFFTQSDRLVQKMASLDELNLNFKSPLKDKYGDSIENMVRIESVAARSSRDEADLIINISEHLIKNIFKYNKDFINHNLNHMLKLDEKLTNKYLIHLWHNEMCEKYVQVGCTSLVNPMHQCSRPAMVKFVYEVATKRDQFRHDIRENRAAYEKLIGNFSDLSGQSKFPHDEIVSSMVALSQLIKRLLRNHHYNPSEDSSNGYILTKLFYLLIDLYEAHMNHPNDVLNPAKSITTTQTKAINLTGWSILFKNSDSLEQINDQFSADSVHLFMFDLIHLIGSNFVHSSGGGRRSPNSFRKTNQLVLLEKIIQKLTATISMNNVLENTASLSRQSSSSSQMPSTRRSSSILLNLTRNKLSLMALCAQYVEPNDLDLFNEFYMSILCSINSILLNEVRNECQSDPNLPSLDSTEMINQKFSIIFQLLTKFSFINLNFLLKNETDEDRLKKICTNFVDVNLNFLSELNLEHLVIDHQTVIPDAINAQIKKRDANLKLILDQCVDNYVSILNVAYPSYFDYILQRILEFSSAPNALKYGPKSMATFLNVIKQNELVMLNQNSCLGKYQYEKTFKYLKDFFMFEKSKFAHKKICFLSHWSLFARQISQINSNLALIYFDKFLLKNIDGTKFDTMFSILCDLYLVWTEPSTILDITSKCQIDVKHIYKSQVASIEARHHLEPSSSTNSQSAILIMIDSLLETFHFVLERLPPSLKNHALNRLVHFYYEQIVCPLSPVSHINTNSLECYHTCMAKYSSTWFGAGSFEPDCRTVNLMAEISSNQAPEPLKYLAFNLVCFFDLSKITDSYFRQPEIKPIQINDLLKCILQLLAEFCLRDSIRESDSFDALLRPVYNQAEVLQYWSMLSDNSYSNIVLDRFLPLADYRYAFASRGVEKGLLMMVLKSAAEFYSLVERNSLSCFSSAKRRLYLKTMCELLLKPSAQSVKTDIESFQNCIMNLLTDIETFSISAVTESINNLNLNHEIQLLVDESLSLITGGDASLTEIYQCIFESWLSSSKDSPILTHFINRLSRNYNLLMSEKSSDTYCRLLELCIEVLYESGQVDLDSDEMEKNVLLSQPKLANGEWDILMKEIDFIKMAQLNLDDLFECKLLINSSYLLLNCYMCQRLAILKASMSYEDGCLKYTDKILASFLTGQSKPKCLNEEKVILILKQLLECFLAVSVTCAGNFEIENIVGAQMVRLANLLIYYGEDILSGQNPCNEGQSIGSDLLASIGLNILAKKSQYSLKFRFYCRSMAICVIKQILVVKRCQVKGLFPKIENQNKEEFGYKIRLSHLDNSGYGTDSFNLGHQSGQDASHMLSTSLPSSGLNSTKEDSILHQKHNQLLKQAAYQFHLIYQTKAYSQASEANFVQLANFVNDQLTQQAQYFCLPQCLNLSKYLCLKLFREKFYLF